MFFIKHRFAFLFMLAASFCFVSRSFARCAGIEKDLKFYCEAKNIFIIKVLDLGYDSGDKFHHGKIYNVSKLRTIRGKINNNEGTEFSIMTDSYGRPYLAEDDDPFLQKDSIYLVQIYFDQKGNARINACSYFVSSNDLEFKHDSLCFESFSGKNTYFKTNFLTGHIVGKRPHGKWVEGGDSGKYLHGKRVGTWVIGGKPVRYKRGKPYGFEEEWNGDTIIKHHGGKAKMVCNGQTLKIWQEKVNGKSSISKFANDVLVQVTEFNGWDEVLKIICYENGKKVFLWKRSHPGWLEGDAPWMGWSAFDFFYFGGRDPCDKR